MASIKTQASISALFSRYNIDPSVESGAETAAERVARLADEVESGGRSLKEMEAAVAGIAKRNGGTIINPSQKAPNPQYIDPSTGVTSHVPPSQRNVAPAAPEKSAEELAREARAAQADLARLTARGLGLPPELVELWVQSWIITGDAELATNELRHGQHRGVYDTHYPGNRREDGTLRFSEQQYAGMTEAYSHSLSSRGLNADLFKPQFANLITGNVSAQEFEQRVFAISEGIANRSEEIRQAFAEASGGVAFDDAALLGAALDPQNIGKGLIERKISVAQVRGTAAEFGFQRSLDRGGELVNLGVGEQQARQFYGQAGQRVSFFDRAARRFSESDADVDITELEQGFLASDPTEQQRFQRLVGREAGSFSPAIGVAGKGGGLSGLREI